MAQMQQPPYHFAGYGPTANLGAAAMLNYIEETPQAAGSFVAREQNGEPMQSRELDPREFKCNWGECSKSYKNLKHLNAHIRANCHGPVRTTSEFQEQIRRRDQQQSVATTAGTPILGTIPDTAPHGLTPRAHATSANDRTSVAKLAQAAAEAAALRVFREAEQKDVAERTATPEDGNQGNLDAINNLQQDLDQARHVLKTLVKQGNTAQEHKRIALNAAAKAKQARAAAEERASRAEQATIEAEERASRAEQAREAAEERASRLEQARAAAEERVSRAEGERAEAWELATQREREIHEALQRVESTKKDKATAEHNQTWAVERFRDAEEQIRKLKQALAEVVAKNRRAEEAANERITELEKKVQQAEQITAASSLPEPAESGRPKKRRRIETAPSVQEKRDEISNAGTEGRLQALRRQLDTAVSGWQDEEGERFIQFEIQDGTVLVRNVTEVDLAENTQRSVIKCVLRGKQKAVSIIQVHSVLCKLSGKNFTIEELDALTASLEIREFQCISQRQYKTLFDAEARLKHVGLYRWEDLWAILNDALPKYCQIPTSITVMVK
ncbi:hypothetical protein NKR23_g2134 [Pleurostoma richardsiae]|uniref:C2H2-type domain-containing protein n=1 Tax=Pleurostoma richardsiae TaxID=41990 RepID=A0AA38VW57_9PEZI|nr:hypothetical protein NKR23_g2134 [Pleurostoma richardsiae]